MQASEPLEALDEWSKQPAYDGGVVEAPTWVIEVAPGTFDGTVDRLKGEGVIAFDDPVEQDGHRMFWVRDPMGNTLEIYEAPAA